MTTNLNSTCISNEHHVILSGYTNNDKYVDELKSYFNRYSFDFTKIIYCKIFTPNSKDYLRIKKNLKKTLGIENSYQVEQSTLGSDYSILIYINNCDIIKKHSIKVKYHRFHSKKEELSKELKEIFSDLNLFLKKNNITLLDNSIRSWIYIDNIDNSYSSVVNARADFFQENGLNPKTRYLASTGIGANMSQSPHKCHFDLLTFDGINRKQIEKMYNYDIMPDTHDYGVHFERGLLVDLPSKKHLYISGTASIDKEGNVVFLNNVIKQTHKAIEVFFTLLSTYGASIDNLTYCIVYLRNKSDFKDVSLVLQERLKNIPYLVVEGPVCRPDWLIELEGLAIVEK